MNTQRYSAVFAGVFGFSNLLLPSLLIAHEPEVMNKSVITGRSDSLVGLADAASEGYVGLDHLEFRPLLRADGVGRRGSGILPDFLS